MSYDQMAGHYDLIYESKDTVREAAMLRWIIAAKKRSVGKTLLATQISSWSNRSATSLSKDGT